VVLVVAASVAAISLRYLWTAGPAEGSVAACFRIVMLIGHSIALSTFALLPLLLIVLLRVRRNLLIATATLLTTALFAGLLIDTQVYSLYRFHINAGVMNLLLGGAAGATFIFPKMMYVQAGVTLLFLITLAYVIARVSFREAHTAIPISRRTRWALALCFLTIPAYQISYACADALSYEPIIRQPQALPISYGVTARETLQRLGLKVSNQPQDALVGGNTGGGLRYPLEPLTCAPQSRPNIIVIAIDSWRFDAMTARATPNINAFSRRGVRFLQHYSGGNATRIGVFTLFYGIPGTYWHRVLAERTSPVFIDSLLNQGYSINVFRSAPLFSPEFDRTVFARVPNARTRSDGARPAEWDRDLTDDFLRFVRARESRSPFFAFLFYDGPHSFDVPESFPMEFTPSAPQVNYLELTRARDPKPYWNRYLNAVRYDDSLVGEVLEELSQRDLLRNSVVVITGDHGQEFNDAGQGFWGHNGNYTRYQTQVPLLIFAPDLAPAQVNYRTSHFDVMPTLLSRYLGCSTPMPRYSVGRSLFEPGGRDMLVMSAYSEFAIVQPDVVTVVRNRGLEEWSADYRRHVEMSLQPALIQSALEQRSRFFRDVQIIKNYSCSPAADRSHSRA
jgi:membrane-anchored protein YejM (alkaline phosphatase superfamily)